MTNERHEAMLDELLELDRGLTAWECDFIDKLDRGFRNLHKKLVLNDRQKAKLEQIYEARIK
jgi:hypothetical protein